MNPVSRCLAAIAACGLLLAPAHSVGPSTAERQRAVSREICRLDAVWDPTLRQTSVAEPAYASTQRWEGLVAGNNAMAAVTVTYDTTFPAAARTAFDAAVDIWKSQLTTSVPVRITAHWSTTLSSGQLGSASATLLQVSGVGTPGYWYPKAILNKLAGSDVDPSTPDITANFNANFSIGRGYYFGIDGNPPSDQYDFESVVLHELGHGLGIVGSANDNGTSGGYGLSDGNGGLFPTIYDKFTESFARQAVLSFPNPSAALHDLYTSDGTWDAPGGTRVTTLDPTTGLYWNGTAGVAAAGGGSNRPRLDAKAPFLAGSNYSHVNEIIYPRGSANSLMGRELANGESVHNPGPIVIGMLTDEGWTAGCTYTLSPTSANVLPTATTGTITVTTAAGCAWSATAPSGSFVTITGGASGIGTGTVSYSVAAAPNNTPRSTTLSIAGLPFTVSQGPQMALDHSALIFGAINSGGTLTSATPAQSVAVSIVGAPGITWTASVTSSSPWLKVTGGSGTGTGTFSVSVQSDPSLAGQTTVTGMITVTSPGSANSPKTVAVTLSLTPAGTVSVPFGAFDTPADNATLQGSVAITGWALDNIGVTQVSVLRDAHPTDPAGAVVNGKVFVGVATLVEGARPDVETASPNSPLNYRAGWGYLLLTRGLVWDGKGPFKLYAQATDVEGNIVTLGSKTVTVNNSTAAVPFGAIDSPAQGATVSGSFPNTGWVLSPGTTIPANGLRVAIDGVFLSFPVLLQGNNYTMQDRSDITTGFPGFNTTGAGRGNVIDTSGYANGTHTIGWLVTDTLGRADGVGSRFFKIQNGSLIATTTAALTYHPESALPGIDAGAPVKVATGMNPKAALKTVRPDAFGRRHVRIDELDRVEVRLTKASGRYAVYQVANGQLRGLPLGATFDRRRGTLYWQPGAGYVGDYEFVVVDQGRRDARRLTRLVVTVGTPSVMRASALRATN